MKIFEIFRRSISFPLHHRILDYSHNRNNNNNHNRNATTTNEVRMRRSSQRHHHQEQQQYRHSTQNFPFDNGKDQEKQNISDQVLRGFDISHDAL